jgi:hypothetical protein
MKTEGECPPLYVSSHDTYWAFVAATAFRCGFNFIFIGVLKMIDSINDTFDCSIPWPRPVPTLVLMLNNMSICDGDYDLYLNQEVFVQITPQIDRMNPGEFIDCYDLFDPLILEITTSSSHTYVLSPIVSKLVAQGKVPLKFVDFSSKLNELYQKI